MIDQIGYWVLVAFGFGFLIFIHELGHFLACKLVGIRIVRFAIGFGPRLFGTNKNADHKDPARRVPRTDYCISAIPCGGYVKMAGGEGEGDAEVTGSPDEYPSKTTGQRALVVLAGPIMSVVAAIPLLFGLFLAGMERPSSRVDTILPGFPAWETGLRRGDVVTGIKQRDGDSWTTIRLARELKYNSVLKDVVGDIDLRVERGGEEMIFAMTTGKDGLMGLGWGGAGSSFGYVTTTVAAVSEDIARETGIEPGWTITEMAGRKVYTWGDVDDAVMANPGKNIAVKFKPAGGGARSATLTVGSEKYWGLGIIASRPNIVRLVRPGFPAEKVLEPGDAVTAFDGQAVKNWPELERIVMERASAGKHTLTFVRKGKATAADVTLEAGDNIGDVLGIAPEAYPVVEGPVPGAKAVIPVGAKLLTARDPKSAKRPVKFKYRDNVHLLRLAGKGPKALALTIEHDGKEREVSVELVEATLGTVELGPRLDMTRAVEPGKPAAALRQAFVETGGWIVFAVRGFWKLITLQLPVDMLSGPVMILTATRFEAEAGAFRFFEFLVLITIHLGVLNLVPFPILDGGHVAFLVVEKIRGKPCPERLMAGLMYGGMALLITLMIFVTGNDVFKIWQALTGR
ncbi:MAG: site-2 protease family protein [Planctomycetota bacterium]